MNPNPEGCSRGDDGDDDDRPPEYSDHGSTDPGLHVFLGGCAGDDASWKVRYAAGMGETPSVPVPALINISSGMCGFGRA